MIAQRSKAFLIEMFTDLRTDLEDRLRQGGRGGPDPDKAANDLAIYEALLTGLRGGPFPKTENVREYVTGLAKATDEANGYEQATLEHRAFEELVTALDGNAACIPTNLCLRPSYPKENA